MQKPINDQTVREKCIDLFLEHLKQNNISSKVLQGILDNQRQSNKIIKILKRNTLSKYVQFINTIYSKGALWSTAYTNLRQDQRETLTKSSHHILHIYLR